MIKYSGQSKVRLTLNNVIIIGFCSQNYYITGCLRQISSQGVKISEEIENLSFIFRQSSNYNIMSQRPLSLQQQLSGTQSLSKENPRKLRQMGSTNNLQTVKKGLYLQQDTEVVGDYIYRKKDKIGSGYTSNVFKCRGTKDHSEYAIKVIDMKKYSNSSLQMLENEIQVLKKMSHPNIIRFENVIKEGNFCYLITQFCSQGDLLQYMTRNGKICEKQATTIISEVIEATKYLFKMGVIHRDIKPANIFKGGKSWKLGDFGFAINAESQIKTKQNVGTPLYMPLEALLRNCYSPESDIFSVGVIFYEMMVGITPWESRDEKELIRKMNTLPFSIPQKYKITSPIKFLLQKMCTPNRDDRMSKQEFMELKIDNFISLISFNERLKTQEYQRRARIFSRGKLDIEKSSKGKGLKNQYLTNHKTSKNQIILVPKVKEMFSSKQKIVDIKNYGKKSNKASRSKSQQPKQEKKLEQKSEHKNCQILINQLNYCRFMYYIIENATYLQLNSINKNKLTLMTFKHLLKLIKHLSDNRNNWFGFPNWDVFRKSSKYQTIMKTLKDYCEKYEKQYLIFLKKAEINVIKEVNQKLPEFSTNQPLSIQFYQKMLTFITPFLRQCNRNLITIAQDVRQCRGEQGVARLQAMRSLYKYYRLLDLSIRQFQNFSHFSTNSNIVVLKNYRQSKMGVADLMRIRQEIKSI